MADLTYRDRTTNCSLTGGNCVEIPMLEGGSVYVFADASKALVASSSPPAKEASAPPVPTPPPAPEPEPEPEANEDAES